MAAQSLALLVATAILFVGSLPTSTQQADGSIEFTYSGSTGPDQWGKLSPDFSMCVNGKLQSPINILTDKVVLNKNLKPLIRSYDPTNVTLVNNKFNIGVRYPDHSGSLIVEGKMYALKQMHWHSPSEHRINGKQYAAELHLVHIADDGSVSVVAILFDYGQPDPLLAKANFKLNCKNIYSCVQHCVRLLDVLQMQSKLNELEYEVKSHEDVPIKIGPFHPTEVRKRCHKYYRYVGSFTTPPCTQNVIWNILRRVRSVSRGQVQALRAPLDLRCKNNARPCQPMNGRHVELYDLDIIAQDPKH